MRLIQTLIMFLLLVVAVVLLATHRPSLTRREVVAIVDSVLVERCPAMVADLQHYSVLTSNVRYLNYVIYRNRPASRRKINQYEAYFKGDIQ